MSTDRPTSSKHPAPPSSDAPQITALTPEKLRELLAEGRSLRGSLEGRLADMQTVPPENLAVRAR